ncbi:hypothetical protein B0H63DRAFT_459220 [Podospora didyma]|uniref:Uncharacterized protein n=1 Tax=Podospora didyma TaxID=330526 RepID=A0AAE0U7Y9_9PEZI|nr:hypothetical protein B0H63DRAFT_459220 [Podospora didyma]
MNRQAVQTAFGRVGSRETATHCLLASSSSSSSSSSSALSCGKSISWQTYTSFSTTTSNLDDAPRPPPHSSNSRQRSEAAASRLGELRRPSAPMRGGTAPPPSQRFVRAMPSVLPNADGPKVFNLRSLRGTLRGRGGGVDGAGPPRRFPLAGAAAGGEDSFRSARPEGAGFTPRGRGRTPGRGAARGGRGRGRGGARRGRKDGGANNFKDDQSKMRISPAEQELINRVEQGEVTSYTPSVTSATLLGYGPAVSTDASIGKVETALRTMRIMGGGRAFNADDGVTADAKEAMRRYRHEKKPLFLNSLAEKAWIESVKPHDLRIKAPEEATKRAIVDMAVLGKYEAPVFADVTDTMGTLASYHGRDSSYKNSDISEFTAKVRALLPKQKAPPVAVKKTA